MNRNVIFLSFASPDRHYAVRFETHVRQTLGADDSLETFLDERDIGPGERWDQTIQDKLEASLVGTFLVSADLFESHYVRDKEAPRLVEAQQRGEAAITCLFVKACNVAEARVRHTKPSGELLAIELGQYQGLNQPTQPLEQLAENRREAALAAAAKKLVELARKQQAAQRTQAGEHTAHGRALVLRVEALPSVPPQWHLTYIRVSDSTVVHEAYARPSNPVTFASLYPATKDDPLATWSRVLRSFDPKSRLKPLAAPFRLLVEAADPSPFAAGWSQVRYDSTALLDCGWSLALRSPGSPYQTNVQIDRAACCLVLTPHCSPHGQSVVSMLHRLWSSASEPPGNQVALVPTAVEARAVLARHPQVVYAVAKARRDDKELWLATTNGELRLTELVAAGPGAPKLLFLTLVDVDSVAAMQAVAACAQRVPVVVLRLGTAASMHDPHGTVRSTSLQALESMLAKPTVPDPALAIQRVAKDALVWCHGGDWRNRDGSAAPSRSRITRELLDRLEQRKLVKTMFEDDLVRSLDRRAHAVVAHGSATDCVAEFGRQVETYLDKNPVNAPFFRLPVSHDFRHATADDFTAGLLDQMGCTRAELGDRLMALVPRHPTIVTRALLLDFGHTTPADVAHAAVVLREWSTFVRDTIQPACPEDLRVLGLLAFQTTGFKAAAKDVAGEVDRDGFLLHVLPPFDDVHAHELKLYFQDRPPPPDLAVDAVTRLLLRETLGKFLPLVECLEREERSHWEWTRQQLANHDGTMQSP